MGYQSQGLYLKLNKRLQIDIKRITIPQLSSSNSSDISLKNIFNSIYKLLSYCESIDIKNLQVNGQNYHLSYKDQVISLKTQEYEIKGMFHRKKDSLELQLPTIYIPSRKVLLSGELHYRYRDGKVWASGYYNVPSLNGTFRIERDGKHFSFKIDSKPTGSLNELFRILKVSSEAKEWLIHRLSANRYQLLSLKGRGDLDLKNGKIIPDFKTLNGIAKLKEVHLRFNDKLKTIDAPSAKVILKNGNLSIFMKQPRYGKHSIDGSEAFLLHLFDENSLALNLNLNYFGRIDEETLKILRTYGINIDLKQKDGNSKIKLSLHIPLVEGKVHIKGTANLFSGTLIYHKKEKFKIKKGTLVLNDLNLKLHSFIIDEKILKGILEGEINLANRIGKFQLFIKRLNIGSNIACLKIRQKKIPIKLAWNRKGEEVRFPTLKSILTIDSKKSLHIYIKDLSLLHPYLCGVLSLISNGNISLDGSIGKSWQLRGRIDLKKSPFYFKRAFLSRFPFSGYIDSKGDLIFKLLGGKFKYYLRANLLQITGINIDLKRLLAQMAKLKSSDKQNSLLEIRGKKTLIRYGKYLLLSDSFNLKKSGNDFIFVSKLGRDRLTITKKNTLLKIDAKNITDKLLHSLINFNGIRNGRYTIHIQGREKSGYRGTINIKGGVLSNFKAYNSLIATINTIPALMTFSSPGFSSRGFELKSAKIIFMLKQDNLHLSKILLVGKSSTIAGEGNINLKSRIINIKLAIRTAREMGNALSKIPLVGYIIFGKDKSFTAGVKITGTLDHPKVNTNPVGEALLYPLDLLWRTLKSPAHLINSAKSSNKSKKNSKVIK